jgi:hypothetical protein
MRPGRELDCQIAQEVFGHRVFVKKRVLYEDAPLGERPLPDYTKDIRWAWEVAEKMSISLIPIENGSWFALVGPEAGWKSPGDFIQYLGTGEFVNSGAAVGPSAPLMICVAAMKAVETRKAVEANAMQTLASGEAAAQKFSDAGKPSKDSSTGDASSVH